MQALLNLFAQLIKKPYLFVGEHPFYTELVSFLNGYFVRIKEEDNEAGIFIDEFIQFICDYYGIKNVKRNGLTVINLFTDNEEQAFYKFLELLNEFLLIKKINL